MTRSNAREIAAHLIYGMDYTGQDAEQTVQTRMDGEYYPKLAEENEVYLDRPNRKQMEYINACVHGVAEHRDALRATIAAHAVGWKIHRISRFVMAVLELAMYEILFVEDVPDNVAANEAVTLTKKYEDDEVGAFVNGILGAFLRGGKLLVNADVPTATDAQTDAPDAEETAQ